ncbi:MULTISPECIES: hypothetical protein [unclassified Paraburkholderia]|uniref:hypothetical protein n=1 Tax=unclassified Paraburkholderia TaxID=2615204 RepID=UPI002AB6D914|nr:MULTISPECIES: hypothetical protein [unclassified Paraburkholderia]
MAMRPDLDALDEWRILRFVTAISYIDANAVDSYWGERGELTDANAWNDAKLRRCAFLSLELWIASSPASGKPAPSAESGQGTE